MYSVVYIQYGLSGESVKHVRITGKTILQESKQGTFYPLR